MKRSDETRRQAQVSRREFLGSMAAAGLSARPARAANQPQGGAARPNVLWIVSEDNGPFLGAYGDPVARTPTLDRLAREGVLFENCFSTAPVCAPSRFTLISGMYATSCGPANHMRAQGKGPRGMRGFPGYLRDAGYYCTNNAKTDYNAPIDVGDAWDESSREAHWRKRPRGKPFFSVFNNEVTHEGQLFPEARSRYTPLERPTDPARVRLPAYHPDAPEFRSDWAAYYDQMARLDGQVAALLAQLEADGLGDDTIVFYYSDNGGVLPRSKRFAYDSGLHVPLIVRFPATFRHLAPGGPGSRISAPVSFVDFAPTMLALAGVPLPAYFQGSAFAGGAAARPKQYAFGFRDRMDERYDMVRTVRDARYRYVRNYMPHRVHGQHVEYMFRMPSVQAWARLNAEGRLRGPQQAFWREKPAEELYDLQSDRDEVNNLAGSAAHRHVAARMRSALRDHLLGTRDNGFIPEGSPLEGYEAARDTTAYPLERILDVADAAVARDGANLPRLVRWMDDKNECVRYWAALGCLMLGEASASAASALQARLADASHAVRIVAAEALCSAGSAPAALPVLEACLSRREAPRTRLQALNALQHIGPAARPLLGPVAKALADEDEYVKRAAERLHKTLG